MLETCSLEDTTHVSKYHWYRVRLWTFPSNWISRRLNASLWSVQKIHIKTLNVKIDRLLLIRYQLKSLERNEEYQLIYLPIIKAKRLEIFLTTIRRITITSVVEVNPSKVRDESIEFLQQLTQPLPRLSYPILIWPASNCERIMHQLLRIAWNWPRWK